MTTASAPGSAGGSPEWKTFFCFVTGIALQTGPTAKPWADTRWLVIALCYMLLCGPCGAAEVIDFADLALPAESFWHGPDPNGVDVDGQYGPERVGQFTSRGASFGNIYDLRFNSWRGFAYSNQTAASTTGEANQFRAVAGATDGSAGVYAMAFGYLDLAPNNQQSFGFDPLDADHLAQLPTITLPADRKLQSALVTNSAYTVDEMQTGNEFAKRFGGASGGDPDWLKLTAYGMDDAGAPLGVAVDFYLADFRAAGSAADYIVNDWTHWDLAPLAAARSLHFNVSSSDIGSFGMNTPAYFALDNLTFTSATLPGDFNDDGAVDAVDYAVWREGGLGGEAFDAWLDNYGLSTTTSTIVVPEPATWLLAGLPLLLLARMRQGRHRFPFT